jgi:uncharacterized protein YjbI with pentapeptide repeats
MSDPFPGSQSVFEGREFRDLEVQGGHITNIEFEGCRFTGCCFLESRFEICHFVDCVFDSCDLGLVVVSGCTFAAVRFRNCQLLGINWTAASWPKVGLLRAIGFENCCLNHSTFFGLSLREMDIIDCQARDVDFAEADLTRANLSGTDLAQSRFLNTNLTETDLELALNYSIAPNQNLLKRTRVTLPEAMALLRGLDIELVE